MKPLFKIGFKSALANLVAVQDYKLEHGGDTTYDTAAKSAWELARQTLRDSGLRPRFQLQVDKWMSKCFGFDIANDKEERCWRFFEESIELVQAVGMTKDDCLRLIDYTYGRPLGAPAQEVGGVRITLSALCSAAYLDEESCAEMELVSVWDNIDKIRKKQATKPLNNSPLPEGNANA